MSDAFGDLLTQEEPLLWSARAQARHALTPGSIALCLGGLALLVLALWLVMPTLRTYWAYAGTEFDRFFLSYRDLPLPGALAVAGVIATVTLPLRMWRMSRTVYAMSGQRAFVEHIGFRNRRVVATPLRTDAQLLVERRGDTATLAFESGRDGDEHATLTVFEGLSRVDLEEALKLLRTRTGIVVQ